MRKNLLICLAALVMVSALLVGCSSTPAATTTEAAPAATEAALVTEAPVATEVVTEALATEETATEAVVEETAVAGLKITGLVTTEMAWSEEEVRAMETMDTDAPNKDGVMQTYTGVSLKALLDLAGLDAGATTLVFVADDGYSAEASVADVTACENCIVSFRDKGGFSLVMPDFEKSLSVKGLVEIQAK